MRVAHVLRGMNRSIDAVGPVKELVFAADAGSPSVGTKAWWKQAVGACSTIVRQPVLAFTESSRGRGQLPRPDPELRVLPVSGTNRDDLNVVRRQNLAECRSSCAAAAIFPSTTSAAALFW